MDVLDRNNVTRVIELRSDAEVLKVPSPSTGRSCYVRAPMVDPRLDHFRDVDSDKTLLDLYRGSVDRNGRTIALAIRAVATGPPGGVLVHCTAGKDRTGVLMALILLSPGTPDDKIIADYAASQAGLRLYFERELVAIHDVERRTKLKSRQHSSPETMRGFLAHVRDKGGVHHYLKQHGVRPAEFTSLSRRLTQ